MCPRLAVKRRWPIPRNSSSTGTRARWARDDGPPGRDLLCSESGAIRPRGSGLGGRFYRSDDSAPLPDPIACDKSPFCKSSELGPRSAPKVPRELHLQSPDIGDWLDNSRKRSGGTAPRSPGRTGTVSARRRPECAKKPDGQGCWHYTRSCSVLRPEAGLHRNFCRRAPSFKMPRGACNLFLSEPGYEPGPSRLVWRTGTTKLRIKIDGEACVGACRSYRAAARTSRACTWI